VPLDGAVTTQPPSPRVSKSTSTRLGSLGVGLGTRASFRFGNAGPSDIRMYQWKPPAGLVSA
jgi:hypothetical protein